MLHLLTGMLPFWLNYEFVLHSTPVPQSSSSIKWRMMWSVNRTYAWYFIMAFHPLTFSVVQFSSVFRSIGSSRVCKARFTKDLLQSFLGETMVNNSDMGRFVVDWALNIKNESEKKKNSAALTYLFVLWLIVCQHYLVKTLSCIQCWASS